MGYSTNYQGYIKFKEITVQQLAYLKKFLGRDVRNTDMEGDIIEYSDLSIGSEPKNSIYCVASPSFYFMEYELLDDLSGLRWNGSEKQNELDEVLQFLIDRMKEKFGKFEMQGRINCQGEELEDRWTFIVDGDKVERQEIEFVGKKITCPHCDEEFILED